MRKLVSRALSARLMYELVTSGHAQSLVTPAPLRTVVDQSAQPSRSGSQRHTTRSALQPKHNFRRDDPLAEATSLQPRTISRRNRQFNTYSQGYRFERDPYPGQGDPRRAGSDDGEVELAGGSAGERPQRARGCG